MFETLIPDRIREVGELIENRINTVESRVIDSLSLRQAKALAVGIPSITTLSVPAAAQSVSEVGSAMCQSGVGQLLGFVFIGAAMYYLGKSILMGMSALDKMNSTNQQEAREGKDKLSSTGSTAAAAFVPAIAGGVFELAGINTISCLTPQSWSIVGTVVPILPY
ncbi:hypothetical protein DMJ13_25990 [halophilic archaeon]|nr:hypothetical protein DMJ13_25990 [halophilic archaeon]